MKFGKRKGITLEQNKDPMLSKDIKVIDACEEVISKINLGDVMQPELLAPHEIIQVAKDARIIDEIDGKRIWKKLIYAVKHSVSSIAVDAVDDEPYISSQVSAALQFSEQLAQGIHLAKRAVGASNVYIEISRNLYSQGANIPGKIGGINVARVSGAYPSEVGKRKHLKGNTLILGACSLIALSEAIYDAQKHTTCFVTVGGDCIANPANYRVPIGYPVTLLLEKAGLISDPKRFILGGSMTGIKVDNINDIMITPSTRGLLVFVSEFKEREQNCIGCGRCTASCPEELSPYYIYHVVNSKEKRNLSLLDADLCIGCGICSYVCPAKLDLQQAVFKAAKIMAKQGGAK